MTGTAGPARLGVVFPELPFGPARWGEIGSLAADAETAGADSIWLTDHLYWHRPAVDVLGALALVAAATERAIVGPCVLQLPLRPAPLVAKSMGFLGALAPGRVVLGVGAGEHEGEFTAAGRAEAFARRGAALDAGIDEVRALLAPGADGTGDRYQMRPGGAPPIWVGGRSGAARRRAARLGDGWVPHLVRAADLARDLPRLADDVDAAGRPQDAVARAAVVAVAVETGPTARGAHRDGALAWLGELYALPPRAFERVLVSGPADQVAAELVAMADVGLDHAVLFPAGPDPVAQLAAVRHALTP